VSGSKVLTFDLFPHRSMEHHRRSPGRGPLESSPAIEREAIREVTPFKLGRPQPAQDLVLQ